MYKVRQYVTLQSGQQQHNQATTMSKPERDLAEIYHLVVMTVATRFGQSHAFYELPGDWQGYRWFISGRPYQHRKKMYPIVLCFFKIQFT